MLLEVDGLTSSYGGLPAIRDISLGVEAGEIVAVIGSNGAGKSTLLKTIAGMMRADAGEVRLAGKPLTRLRLHEVTQAGVALVPEGRRLFPRLKVKDNLRLGSYMRRGSPDRDRPLAFVFALFPRLAERMDQRAETLSGGEQQMLAVGRALMTEPKLLMLDEPSQGIMPKLVDEILLAIKAIRDHGTTVLIVEQRVMECMEIADRGYVLQSGRIVMSAPTSVLRDDPAIRKAYLGI
jgi:branched-chain amino acid transport system ATP-binding protein